MANWQQVVTKAEHLAEWNAWKKSLEKWEIADRREGPSPGEPSGATPSETPPASDDADTPVQGRWRGTLGKWQEKYDSSADSRVQERDEDAAAPPLTREETQDIQIPEILRLVLSLTEDMRSVMTILGVSTTPALGKEQNASGGKASKAAAPKESPVKKSLRGVGAEVIRAAAAMGL